MRFIDKLNQAIKKNNSLVCVGLDPDFNKIPDKFKSHEKPLFSFNKEIIDMTADLVCSYKPNSAFYEARGAAGILELKDTCDYINDRYPGIPIILDAKRGDIGNTNNGYIKFAYEYLGVDAITLHPYLGKKSLQPFFDIAEKGCIIMCQNSNEGSEEFQSLVIGNRKLNEVVAENVANKWNTNNNCMLVVAATFPEEMAKIRTIAGDNMYFLVPGIGAQGGDLEKTMSAGLNSQKSGLIISSSRAIIFTANPREAAQTLRVRINQSR